MMASAPLVTMLRLRAHIKVQAALWPLQKFRAEMAPALHGGPAHLRLRSPLIYMYETYKLFSFDFPRVLRYLFPRVRRLFLPTFTLLGKSPQFTGQLNASKTSDSAA